MRGAFSMLIIMTTGKAGGLLCGCKPPILRNLQIFSTASDAAGYFRLPCVKGGGTAYAVTEGLSHYYLQNNPSVSFADSSPYTGEAPLRRDCQAAKASFELPR